MIAVLKELGEILSLIFGLIIALILLGLMGLSITKFQEAILLPAVRRIKKMMNRS
ncbi:hypothetical protein ACQKL5_11325 [Peribacillus sp. NPDC097675]|uniref:hypothetical protein n=1 Tax=Peribacillus sp. NPDC097675 TaxID=3390618 RepID=UPI003D035CA4